MPVTSRPLAIRQAATAVRRRCIALIMATNLMANRLLGFIQAVIAGDAVLSRFQSRRVKSILRVIGARGGAAKLNHTVLKSMTQEDVRPLLLDTDNTGLVEFVDLLSLAACGSVELVALADDGCAV